MSKVVLVNPPLEYKARLYKELAEVKIIYPPLGLLYLAGSLRKAGHKVKIVDLEIRKESFRASARRILEKRPDVVGMTATTIAIGNAAKLAGELEKLNRKVPIVLGGVHVTAVPERTMKLFPQFDFGVVGEGEKMFPEFLRALEKRENTEKMAGLVYRKGRKILVNPPCRLVDDLDSLPLPAFDLLSELEAYGGSQFIGFEKRPTFRLVTSRGCPFYCWFCARTVFGNRWRAHSPDYVMKMVKILYEDFGMRHIYFSDDTFTVNKERVKEICRRLVGAKLDLTWDCNARVDTVDLPLLRWMKRAGCTDIAYGIESGNQKILNLLNKGLTLAGIRRTCDWTAKVGIGMRGNFMIANPGETEQTMRETIDFAKSLPLSTFKMSFFTPFPGTEFYGRIHQYGEYHEDWEKLSKYSPVFIPKGLTLALVEKYYKKGFFEFYFRPKMVVSYLGRIRSWGGVKLAVSNFITLFRFIFGKYASKFILPLKRLERVKYHGLNKFDHRQRKIFGLKPMVFFCELRNYLLHPRRWRGFRKLHAIKSWLAVVVTVVIFGVIFRKVDWQGVWGALKLARWEWLVLSLVISTGVNIFGVTDKWRWILKALGYPLPYKGLLEARIGSYALRGILPLKTGEISRVMFLKKFYGVPAKAGGLSVIFGLILNGVVLLMIILAGWWGGILN